MGLANLQSICSELVNAGLPDSTPAAAIHGGSTQQQRKVIATLADLAEAVARADLKSPVTTIVGKVVALSAELDWFQGDGQQDQGIDHYDPIKLARA
jgi:siroheme synthase